MTKIKISNSEVEQILKAPFYDFPKFSTQIINLVNGNAQGTRPNVVGQMSDLIQEFDGNSLQEWKKWYLDRYPDAVISATDKIYKKFLEMKKSMDAINRSMIKKWVEDLIFTKTYCGLKFQNAIIQYIAYNVGEKGRVANAKEERKGIDGYIGDIPVQIKPITYKNETRLFENINVPIIYYDKKKDGINIEFDADIFEK